MCCKWSDSDFLLYPPACPAEIGEAACKHHNQSELRQSDQIDCGGRLPSLLYFSGNDDDYGGGGDSHHGDRRDWLME